MSTPAPTTFLNAGFVTAPVFVRGNHVVPTTEPPHGRTRVYKAIPVSAPLGLSSGFAYTGTAHPPPYGQLWSRGGARRGT